MLSSSHAVRSFTVSNLFNEISTTTNVINHVCMRYALFMCSFEYCHLLELDVKCAALHRTFIPQSFITGNNSNSTVAGLVRGVVVEEGGHVVSLPSVTRGLVV